MFRFAVTSFNCPKWLLIMLSIDCSKWLILIFYWEIVLNDCHINILLIWLFQQQAGVIPLDKLIVREKAGEGSRAIYLIYSKNTAEMFEFECQHPKDKKIWLESIRYFSCLFFSFLFLFFLSFSQILSRVMSCIC